MLTDKMFEIIKSNAQNPFDKFLTEDFRFYEFTEENINESVSDILEYLCKITGIDPITFFNAYEESEKNLRQ